jgi:hypothetical protein
VTAWWNRAALDRLLDKRHAAVVEGMITSLGHHGWRTATEVTFSEWGERGSIDVLGAHEPSRSIVVGEAKSEWGSIEETIRRLDVKERLVSAIAEKRFGFVPAQVAVLLVFPEDRTARRIARRYDATLSAAFPARNAAIGRWLRQPDGPLRGLWFLPNVDLRRRGPRSRS